MDRRLIAKSECGNYGEDMLHAWKSGDGSVVLERLNPSGASKAWRLEPGDTLRVMSDAWGSGAMVGTDSRLALLHNGQTLDIAHFELSFAWGGPSPDKVAELARAVAAEAGCAVEVKPLSLP